MNTPADAGFQRSPGGKILRRSARKNPCATPKKLFASEKLPKGSAANGKDAARETKNLMAMVEETLYDASFPIREDINTAYRKEVLDYVITLGNKQAASDANKKRLKALRLMIYEVQETEWRYPKLEDLLGNS